MSLSKEEREFAVNFTDADTLADMTVTTRSWMTKMDKLVAKFPNTYKVKREIILDGELCGKIYTFPKNLISIRQPSTRVMSDEQKLAAAERMKKLHNK